MVTAAPNYRTGVFERANGIVKSIQTSPHPFRFLVSRVLRLTGACRYLSIQRDEYKLRFFPSSYSATLWADSSGISDDERFLRDFLKPGDVVVDVGANIGTYAIASAIRVGAGGRVYAYEAHPKTVEFLRQNVELNDLNHVVSVIHCAAGAEAGEAFFSNQRSDDQNCILEGAACGIRVPVRTLDSLLSGQSVDLIKIDVEGFELMVLRGAQHVLAQTRAIYFEAWDRHFVRYGYTFAELWDFLAGTGFMVVNVHTHEPVERSAQIPECVNLLAVKAVFHA